MKTGCTTSNPRQNSNRLKNARNNTFFNP